MDARRLERCCRRLNNRLPLVGTWLRRRAMRALLRDGSTEAVTAIAQAVTAWEDGTFHELVRLATSLNFESAINALCAVWEQTRHPSLRAAISTHGWVASGPPACRVLTALLSERPAATTRGGPELVPGLVQACRDRDEHISSRAKAVLRKLQNQASIDALCQAWCTGRDEVIQDAIAAARYVATEPPACRVLTALLSERPEAITQGGPELVPGLVQACRDRDEHISSRAKAVLCKLQNQPAIDALCKAWLARRDAMLRDAIAVGRYVATGPPACRVLTALLSARPEAITQGGPELVRGLLQACADRDEHISSRAKAVLRKLQNQPAIDALCKAWLARRDAMLRDAIAVGRYVATGPPACRILTALLAERLDVITRAGPEVVAPTLAACEDKDPELASRAKRALRQLQNPEAQEELCQRFLQKDNRFAREAIVQGGYAPRDAVRRALVYFLTGQWEKYDVLDFDRQMLRAVYQSGDEALRQRIMAQARAGGRLEWVDVAAGGQAARRLGEMTQAEWQTALVVLKGQRQWDAMWQLAQRAPPRWSAQLLQRLGQCGWQPPEAERSVFAQLVALAKRWQEPDLVSAVRHLKTLQGHTELVNCLAISPDGRLLASGSSDKTVRLWGLPGGQHLKTLEGHTGAVECLAISPDGQLLASGSVDKTVRLWGLPEGRHLKTLQGHTGAVECLAISPDGQLLASGSVDKTVRLWGLPEGRHLKTLEGHTWDVTCLAISPDGRLLTSGSEAFDKTVRLWGLPEGRHLKTLKGHTWDVTCLVIRPDGRLLASASGDGTVRLWSLPDGRDLKTLIGHTDRVRSLAISPDGELLASTSDDKTVRLWRLPEGQHLKTLEGHTGGVECVAISPDGRLLASGGGVPDQTARLWGLPDGRHLKTLQGHTHWVRCLAISPDGWLLASGSADKTVQLWGVGLYRLASLPVQEASPQHLVLAQAALQDGQLSEAQRRSLEFIAALLRWQMRFAIQVEEAPRLISAGEFDIEIEG